MKNLLPFLFVFTILNANAQKWEVGPKIGANVIPIRSTDLGVDFQLGGYGGLAIRYTINDRFKVETGLHVSQQKKAYSGLDTRSLLDDYASILDVAGINVELDIIEKTEAVVSEVYLHLPVLFSYHMHNVDFFLGPYFGALLAANHSIQTTTTVPIFQVVDIAALDTTGLVSFFLPDAEEVTSSTSTERTGLNTFDVGATVGVGYRMDRFHLALSYTQGFLDYREDRGAESFSGHQAIRLSLSYLIPIKQKKKDRSAPVNQ